MEERYIVFDVETPNSHNDRMSAIGVTVVHNGEIVDEMSTLVDPETYFADFNVELTGITPAMAAEAPNFPAVWENLEPIFRSGVLVAHNARFDMSVLAKCLRHYGLAWKEVVPYACTVIMGRACYPELESHRLNVLCSYLDIPLDHHQAGSDSRAAAELLLDYMRHGLDVRKFIRAYDLKSCRGWQ